jgi:predicted aspartyl protease
MNGIGFRTTALVDTGAQAELLMSLEAAHRARKQLRAKAVRLEQPLQLEDYRKQPVGQVVKSIMVILEIDGRCFPNQKF